MTDHYATLGLPRYFTLDLAEVERLYLAKSRALHPDFHSQASEAEQRASLHLTAVLNEAYLALKDPYRRVEHLVALHGGPAAAQEKNLDQMFLMEMMDLRERIDAARASGQGLAALETDLQSRLKALLEEAGKPFDRCDQPTSETLTGIRRQLNCAKTIKSLLRDLHAD